MPATESITKRNLRIEKPQDPAGLTVEAWSQGFMVGSLIIMACIAISNMKRHVLLHKLILLELFLGMFHGTFVFTSQPVYHWYLSVTAILLNISWSLHNVIAWIKCKPFLPRWGSRMYIISVAAVQPYWILEIVANFLYFSNTSKLFVYIRPYEALFRDPWWIFTVLNLLWNIKIRYDFGFWELIRVAPRFAVLLGAMFLSICFMILDILAVTKVIIGAGSPDGINPYWKLSFVFKCLTDTIVLDDFKTALDRLRNYKMENLGKCLINSIGVKGGTSNFETKMKDSVISPTQSFPEMQENAWAKDSSWDPVDLEAALKRKDHGKNSKSSAG